MIQPRQQKRANTEDSIGLGIEAAVIMALFFGIGFVVDRIFGTTPVFMIVFTVLGAIGLFAKFKYRYDERMAEHEAKRLAARGRNDDRRAA